MNWKQHLTFKKVLLAAAFIGLLVWFCRPLLNPVLYASWIATGSRSFVYVDCSFDNGKWITPWFGRGGAAGFPPVRPLGGAMLGRVPLPTQAEAHWFNLCQRRFYKAVLEDPEIPKKALQIVESHPTWVNRKQLDLVVVVGDAGEFELWLSGGGTPGDPKATYFMEPLGKAQGYEVPGDLSEYTEIIERSVKNGKIPPEPVPPHKQGAKYEPLSRTSQYSSCP